MLIQTAFFLAYFIISLPAAKIIDWIGYKRAIIVGLSTMIAACLLVPLRVVAENYRVGIAPDLAKALKVPADLVDLRWSFARVHGDI